MPTQSDDDFDKDLAAADDAQFAKFSGKLKLAPELVQTICPAPVDLQALKKLMATVNGAATENAAKAHLIENVETYGTVIIRLLKTVAIA